VVVRAEKTVDWDSAVAVVTVFFATGRVPEGFRFEGRSVASARAWTAHGKALQLFEDR